MTELDGNVSFSNQEQVKANDRPEAEKQTQSIDVDGLKQSIVQEVKTLLEENNRHQQGLRKKMENRVAKTMNELIAAQQSAGVEMTKEQTQLLESHVRQQIEADEDQAESAPAPIPANKQVDKADPVTEFVNKAVEKIYAKAGFGLAKNDPEAEGLDDIKDPDEFILEVNRRVAEKAKRIEIAPEARTPTMSTGGPAGNMESEYKKEMLAHKGEGYAVAETIKEKYRKLKVDVDSISLMK